MCELFKPTELTISYYLDKVNNNLTGGVKMFDQLSAPQKGDIFHQRAIIVEEKPGNRPSYILHISDENGVIAGEINPEINKGFVFVDNFRQLYAPDPNQGPDVYICRVKVVDYDTDSDKVHYVRLTIDGKSNEVICREKRNKFVKIFFLPDIIPANQIDRD